MSIDILHTLVTAVIIFAVVLLLNRTPLAKSHSKGKKMLITFIVLFVILLALNLIWPYGSGL